VRVGSALNDSEAGSHGLLKLGQQHEWYPTLRRTRHRAAASPENWLVFVTEGGRQRPPFPKRDPRGPP
jgi:hypothetical protein